jgi:hypothetical protein
MVTHEQEISRSHHGGADALTPNEKRERQMFLCTMIKLEVTVENAVMLEFTQGKYRGTSVFAYP